MTSCWAGYGNSDPGEEAEKTLADISLSLVLLLTNHCTGERREESSLL